MKKKQVQQFEEQQVGDTQVQEQQYMVFQDLQNVAGILAETLAVLEYFKDEPDHPYTTVAKNRFVLQVNLSNGILCDIFQTNQDGNHKKQFEQSKKQAKDFFEYIRNELLKKENNQLLENNEIILKCADHYENTNLNQYNVVKQIQPLPNKVQTQFNQQAVQKLINGMFEVDNKVASIKQGNGYKIPSKESILDQAQKRHDLALKKLEQNFPEAKQQNKEEQLIQPDSPKQKKSLSQQKIETEDLKQMQPSKPQQQQQQQNKRQTQSTKNNSSSLQTKTQKQPEPKVPTKSVIVTKTNRSRK